MAAPRFAKPNHILLQSQAKMRLKIRYWHARARLSQALNAISAHEALKHKSPVAIIMQIADSLSLLKYRWN